MGYTHYWTVPATLMTVDVSCLAVVQSVLRVAYDERIVQLEFDNPACPIVRGNLICFNGVGDEGHETFLFSARAERSFCKTARKPYDEVVMKVLLLLAYHHKVKIASDGRFSGDLWTPQRRWLEKLVSCHTYVHETLEITS